MLASSHLVAFDFHKLYLVNENVNTRLIYKIQLT